MIHVSLQLLPFSLANLTRRELISAWKLSKKSNQMTCEVVIPWSALVRWTTKEKPANRLSGRPLVSEMQLSCLVGNSTNKT